MAVAVRSRSPEQAAVWSVERRGSGSYATKEIIGEVNHPNGLLWRPAPPGKGNGTELLFSETQMNVVFRYDYSVQDGTLGPVASS